MRRTGTHRLLLIIVPSHVELQFYKNKVCASAEFLPSVDTLLATSLPRDRWAVRNKTSERLARPELGKLGISGQTIRCLRRPDSCPEQRNSDG